MSASTITIEAKYTVRAVDGTVIIRTNKSAVVLKAIERHPEAIHVEMPTQHPHDIPRRETIPPYSTASSGFAFVPIES